MSHPAPCQTPTRQHGRAGWGLTHSCEGQHEVRHRIARRLPRHRRACCGVQAAGLCRCVHARSQPRRLLPVVRGRPKRRRARPVPQRRDRVPAVPDARGIPILGPSTAHRRPLHARARQSDPTAHREALQRFVAQAGGPAPRVRRRDQGDLRVLPRGGPARLSGRVLHLHVDDAYFPPGAAFARWFRLAAPHLDGRPRSPHDLRRGADRRWGDRAPVQQ
ncbi:unannotated protein [freshwater metagenome]|uniref:Unannotated protein n=1 Tax=freshwater metagenome TaxID=449393 RepID=A0A6J6URS8_9ZZZZ